MEEKLNKFMYEKPVLTRLDAAAQGTIGACKKGSIAVGQCLTGAKVLTV